jgi:hypothetical protein
LLFLHFSRLDSLDDARSLFVSVCIGSRTVYNVTASDIRATPLRKYSMPDVRQTIWCHRRWLLFPGIKEYYISIRVLEKRFAHGEAVVDRLLVMS